MAADVSVRRSWFTEDRSLGMQLLDYKEKCERNEITPSEMREVETTYKRLLDLDIVPGSPGSKWATDALWDALIVRDNFSELSAKQLVHLALEHLVTSDFNGMLLLNEICTRLYPNWAAEESRGPPR